MKKTITEFVFLMADGYRIELAPDLDYVEALKEGVKIGEGRQAARLENGKLVGRIDLNTKLGQRVILFSRSNGTVIWCWATVTGKMYFKNFQDMFKFVGGVDLMLPGITSVKQGLDIYTGYGIDVNKPALCVTFGSFGPLHMADD